MHEDVSHSSTVKSTAKSWVKVTSFANSKSSNIFSWKNKYLWNICQIFLKFIKYSLLWSDHSTFSNVFLGYSWATLSWAKWAPPPPGCHDSRLCSQHVRHKWRRCAAVQMRRTSSLSKEKWTPFSLKVNLLQLFSEQLLYQLSGIHELLMLSLLTLYALTLFTFISIT